MRCLACTEYIEFSREALVCLLSNVRMSELTWPRCFAHGDDLGDGCI